MGNIYLEDHDFTLWQGDVIDCLRQMPDGSVHTCVTSPPYWGLRDYGIDGQLGLEETPDAYVARMVAVFREVRRVLRDDGTLWLNLGDSYATTPTGNRGTKSNLAGAASPVYQATLDRYTEAKQRRAAIPDGLKPKDLVGIPWRAAFALQADGWWLRSDIIWAKPNPMPESVTDRPTKSHEYVFLLTKSARYFFDADAVREKAEWARWGDQTNGKHEGSGSAAGWIVSQSKDDIQAKARGGGFSRKYAEAQPSHGAMRLERPEDNGTRNVRSVWEIATQPYAEAHFATFPQELPRRCIAAGTSERGCCPECGAPWERQTETTYVRHENWFGAKQDARHDRGKAGTAYNEPIARNTTDWKPTCDHGHDPVPCTVLDPFLGSGTTAYVARTLGRRSIGIELNPDYCALAARRMQQLSLLATP